MATTFPLILRDNDIAITIDGIPYNLRSSDSRYAKVKELIRGDVNNDKAIKAVFDQTTGIVEFVKSSSDQFEFHGTTVTYRGDPVSEKLANRITRMAAEGISAAPLARFCDRLELNPSKRVHDELYAFLERGGNAITPDGFFYAYKRVNKKTPTPDFPLDPRMAALGYDFNLVDCHTGKFNNAVGSIVEMPRRKVNDDPSVTCSYGLHVCSHSYLKSFSGDVVLTCKIDPADVVAVPKDYQDAKMRCCKYEIINILDEDKVSGNVLASKAVMDLEVSVDEDEDEDEDGELDGEDFDFDGDFGEDDEDDEEDYQPPTRQRTAKASRTGTSQATRWFYRESAHGPLIGAANRTEARDKVRQLKSRGINAVLHDSWA